MIEQKGGEAGSHAGNLFVGDIEPNDRVNGTFFVKHKTLGWGKTGKAYLSVTLMDRTGEIDGRIWDEAEEFNRKFRENDYVWIEAIGTRFLDRVQLRVEKLKPVDASTVDPMDYLPSAGARTEGVKAKLRRIVESVEDIWVRRLLEDFLADATFAMNFFRAPAAKSIHHAYLGGLLEHTVSMMELADTISRHYIALGNGYVNRDLVLAGAFLHDVGKTRELSTEPGFNYTDEGRLIGHIEIGAEMLDKKAGRIEGFPADLHLRLKHMILSHHGEYEYGSPRRPKTIEAVILHYIDNLDSKVQSFTEVAEGERGSRSDWTAYNGVTDRYLYKKIYKSQIADEDARSVQTGAAGRTAAR